MLPLFPKTFSKLCLNNFLLLLIFFSYQLKSQQPGYLSCTTTPTNTGNNFNLIPCLDQLQVSITYGSSFDSIYFDFPAGFELNGTISNSITYPITNNQGGTPIPLFRIAIEATISGGIINFSLNYTGCGNTANTPLQFFCSGRLVGGLIVYASLPNPMVPVAGSATNSPIIFPPANSSLTSLPIVLTNLSLPNLPGNVGDNIERLFKVSVSHANIDTFRIRFNQEQDAAQVQLEAYNLTNTTVSFPLGSNATGTFFVTIDLATLLDSNILTTNGPLREFGIRQRVLLNCNTSNSTLIQAFRGCACAGGTSVVLSSSFIQHNVQINTANINLTVNPIPQNSGCADTLRIESIIANQVLSSNVLVDSLVLPFNNNRFELSSIRTRAVSDANSSNWQIIPSNSLLWAGNNSIIIIPSTFFSNAANSNLYTPSINSSIGSSVNLILPVGVSLVFEYSFIPICDTAENCTATPFNFNHLNQNQQVEFFGKRQNCNTIITRITPIPILQTQPNAASVGGGCDEEDYDTGLSPTISFNYSFNLQQVDPFQILNNNDTIMGCSDSIQYYAVFQLVDPDTANVSISEIVLNDTLSVTAIHQTNTNSFFIPLNEANFESLNQLSFNFKLTGCPFNPAKFGNLAYNLKLMAVCSACFEDCNQTLACQTGSLFVHCPGNCGVDFIIETKKVSTERSTLGWLNDSLFTALAPPLTIAHYDSLNLNEIEKRNELRKVYPYDIFRLSAIGNSYPIPDSIIGSITTLGFEMGFSSTFGDSLFEFLNYSLTMVDTISNDTLLFPLTMSAILPDSIPGVQDTMMVVRFNTDTLPDSLSNKKYRLFFNADLRVSGFLLDAILASTDYNIDFRGQFINTNDADLLSFSCDPYGSKVRILIPQYTQLEALQPYTTDTLILGNQQLPYPQSGTCVVKQSTQFALSGGLGNTADDFPFEYRPMLKWPNTGMINNGIQVSGTIPPANTYNLNTATGVFANNQFSQLLRPMEKGTFPFLLQAIGFTASKNCPLGAYTDTIQLGTLRCAYLHNGHNLATQIVDSIQTISNPIINQNASQNNNQACGSWLSTSLSSNTNVGVMNQHAFNLNVNNTTAGSFFWVNLELTNNVNASSFDQLALGSMPNGVTIVTNTGTQILLYFSNGANVNTALPIILNKNNCLGSSLSVSWGSLCSVPNSINFTNLNNACTGTCNSSFSFTALANTNLTVSNKQIQPITTPVCGLSYSFTVANAASNPPLSFLNPSFTLPAGLLYNSGTYIQNGTVFPLISPNIQATSNNGMQPVIILSFIDSITVQPGQSVQITLNFRVGENICMSGLNSNIQLLGGATVARPCATSNALLNLNHFFNALPSNPFTSGNICCVPTGITITHDIICNTNINTGTITVNISNPDNPNDTIYASNFQLLIIGPADTTITIDTAQTSNIFNAMPAGLYTIAAINNNSGIFQLFVIELYNRTIIASIAASDTVICAGETIQLTASNSNAYAEPITSYEWTSFYPYSTININDSIILVNPTQYSTYEVILQNQYGCSGSTSVTINVNQLPLVSISNVSDTVCTVLSLTPSLSPAGGTLWLNGLEIPELPIDLSAYNEGDYQLIYSFTDSLGCNASDTTNFWLSSEPLCPCPDCGDPNLTQQLTIPSNITDAVALINLIGTGNTISNYCIRLNHNFLINTELHLDNCKVIVAPGIVIRNDISLLIRNTEIKGCLELWRGIENFGKLGVSDSSLIRDAIYAIHFFPNSGTSIVNSTLINNFICVIDDDPSHNASLNVIESSFLGGALLTPYNKQPEVTGLHSYAGIVIRHGIIFTNFKENYFHNLCIGVLNNASTVESYYNVFDNIQNFEPIYTGSTYYLDNLQDAGVAIYATRNARTFIYGLGNSIGTTSMFVDAKVGVYNYASRLLVQDCHFTSGSNLMDKGVYALNPDGSFPNNVFIRKNLINNAIIGIDFQNTDNLLLGDIKENIITTTFNSINPRWGIKVNNFLSANSVIVEKNTIKMTNTRMFHNPFIAIDANSGSGIRIRDNQVEITGTAGQGIRLTNSPGARITCNSVSGATIFNPNQQVSFYQSMSANVRIVNNTTDGTNTGLRFLNTNFPTDLRCNVIKSHKDGLSITSGTIGDQNYKHNQWVGTYTGGFGAKVNVNNLFNNRFFVHAGADATYYPFYFPNYQSNCFLGNFFQCDQVIQPNCVACSTGTNPPSGIVQTETETAHWLEIARKLALDSLQFPEYNAEYRFYTLRDLEAAIHRGAIVLPDTGYFIPFRASLNQSMALQLNVAEHQFIATLPGNLLRSQIGVFDADWQAFMTNLAEVNELIDANPNDSSLIEFRNYLWLQMSLLEQQINLIKQGALQAQGYTRDSSFTYLGGLVTQQEFEEYDRVISQIYLSTIAQGNYSFSEQDSSTIYNIASLCPALGGKSVYKARSLYSLLNDSIFFDDDSLCVSQSVMFRLQENMNQTQVLKAFAKIYPNPTQDLITIDFENDLKSPVTFKLYNALGKLITSRTLNKTFEQLSLKELSNQNGLYFFELIDSVHNHRQTGKISLVK